MPCTLKVRGICILNQLYNPCHKCPLMLLVFAAEQRKQMRYHYRSIRLSNPAVGCDYLIKSHSIALLRNKENQYSH
jgi:hypothetical protein